MTYLGADRDGGVRIAMRGATTSVAVSRLESPAVARAARDLIQDLGKACRGARTTLVHEADDAHIVVGTVGVSPLVDAAITAGDVDVSVLQDDEGGRAWEAFTIQTAGERVFIVGSDPRGTIYGIYDLCEAIGVSPWWWFGDVPVRSQEHLSVRRGTRFSDRPSVKYRGVFLNDEEELDNWARAHTPDGTIGPATYARVFELILRLKGNYVWPAMHVNAFNHDPENGRLADEMGIVVGTSHCDMLLRSNQHEFAPWVAAQDEPVTYDYSIPGRNRDMLREYWRGSVAQNGGYEVSWTVGMRGIHDSDFVTSAIDADETLSPSAKQRAKVALLEKVISDQRTLLAEELGDSGRDRFQIFVPYKEVLQLYDSGLDVPDDVTIVWANDNFGYMRRFPSEAELSRPGGHGLYYHSSYWSAPPASYLATSSTPLALMQSELRKSWDRGIRTLWIDNIGGLKPLELEMEYFLRLAWEAGKESTTTDVADFVESWVDANFSGMHGAVAGRLYARYYQLNNQRKIEHLDAGVFSQTAYGDEALRRLTELRALFEQVNDIVTALPDDERDPFFQMFAIKIHLAYLVSAEFLYADRSALAFRQGRFPAADLYVAISRAFAGYKRAILYSYNHVMADGKWRLMLTPEEAPPPAMALHPVAVPALRIGAGGADVAVWGADTPGPSPRLVFWPYGMSTKWIDLFTTGVPELEFTVTSDEWIAVSEVSGTTATDRRIHIGIADLHAAAGRRGAVTIEAAGKRVEVIVEVAKAPGVAPEFHGTVEADGFVCIDPSCPNVTVRTGGSSWENVQWLGRYANAAIEARGGYGGYVEYNVHLATPGAHLLELHRLPTLNSTGEIRVGVSVDEGPAVCVSSPTTDEYRGDWKQAVLDNVERLRLWLPYLDAGEHVIRLHAVDDDVAISKLVIYTEQRRESNLGPPFSHHTGAARSASPDPEPLTVGLAALAVLKTIARDIYRVDPADLLPPAALYAGRDYYEDGHCVALPQERLGKPRYLPRADGAKDIFADDLRSGPAVEAAGRIYIEAEDALADGPDAWTTPSVDGATSWTHVHAETNGGAGLAMWVDAPGKRWERPSEAPGLHYALVVGNAARYRAWLLVKFNHRDDDACWLALDGEPLPAEQQFMGGQRFGWDVAQRWHWACICDVDLTAGRHILSILAREAGLRVDRIYLTSVDELPPSDGEWDAM